MSRSIPGLSPLVLALLLGCQGTIDSGDDEDLGDEEAEDAGASSGGDLRRPRDAGRAGDAPVQISLDGAQARADLARAPADLAQATAVYPPGPYGNKVGSVLGNIVLSGYRLTPQQGDPAVVGWATDISFAEYHRPQCQCLLITVGASSCGACAQEQPLLKREVLADPGFCVLNILEEGLRSGVYATRTDVDNWVAKYHQNFYVVQGSPATKALKTGYGPTIKLPFNLIVRPSDMVVVGVVEGFVSNIHSRAMGLCGS